MLVIPGFGFGAEIFDDIPLDHNVLSFPDDVSPSEGMADLEKFLREKRVETISLLGWSKGVYAACGLVRAKPFLCDKIFLIGARPFYPPEDIERFRENLSRNARGTMIDFYKRCLSPEENGVYREFYQKYLRGYIARTAPGTLMAGIDELSRSRLDMTGVPLKRVAFIHGLEDKVAPIGDMERWKPDLGPVYFIAVDGAGHMPFLREDVCEIISRF